METQTEEQTEEKEEIEEQKEKHNPDPTKPKKKESDPKQKKMQKEDPVECQICANPYNKSSRTPVACNHCQYETCRKCCETYLLNITEPKCMNTTCNKPWTRRHMVETMTHSFMQKAYKQHCQRVLFDKEQAMLPETQLVIEQLNECEYIKRQIKALDEEYKRLQMLQYDILVKKNELNSNMQALIRNHELGNRRKEERRQFIRKCGDDECRGFLSTQWKCGLCNKWTCNKCHVVKQLGEEEQHECKEADVETAKLISSDSKPCPKCGVMIYKINGCDQMWCIICHIAFSWNRGTVETTIHNPHYYEWLRRNGNGDIPRNPNDVLCGRVLSHDLVPRKLIEFDKPLFFKLQNILMDSLHIQEEVVPKFAVDPILNNENLRIKYMRKEISEETFRQYLHRDNKKYDKKKELYNILQVFLQSVTDILYRFRHVYDENVIRQTTRHATNSIIGIREEAKPILKDILFETDALVAYINECFEDVSRFYNCVTWNIDIDAIPNDGIPCFKTVPRKNNKKVEDDEDYYEEQNEIDEEEE